jgi:transposase
LGLAQPAQVPGHDRQLPGRGACQPAVVIRAHRQLGGPIVLVRDNLRLHLVAPLREFFEANAAWLTLFQLPTYAPDLNP